MSNQRDGIHKLYHPHIADQIPASAASVKDVVNKQLPVEAKPNGDPVMSQEQKGVIAMQVTETIMSVPTPEGKIATLHLPAYMTGFLLDIDRMNEMYKMPTVDLNNMEQCHERLEQFKSILAEECAEIDDIIQANITAPVRIDVALADLLGDIIVYCASEAKRWGIPIDRVLNIIMQSNFSKLDENGQPIYDERMKLLKGPGYWAPEVKIAELLTSLNQPQGE